MKKGLLVAKISHEQRISVYKMRQNIPYLCWGMNDLPSPGGEG